MERIAIKIGSNVLTKKDGHLNKEAIANLVFDIVKIKKENKIDVVLISSGAVSTGRSVKSLRNLKVEAEAVQYDKQIIMEQILAAVGQPKLMAFYTKNFEKYKIDCAQILATRAAFADRQSYLSIRTVTLNLLKAGIVPIFNENDVLSPEELDFSDNDQLACMVAAMLMVDKLIVLTDVDGLYDGIPGNEKSKIFSVIKDASKYLNKVDDKSGTGKGGMKSKLLSADLITCLGIDMAIANGFKKNIVSKITKGEGVGTYFPARCKKLKPIKNWLATSAVSGGKIIVSNYIADMIKNHRTASVLFTGIENIEGNFQSKDVVEVCDADGAAIAKGIAKHGSIDLKKKIDDYLKLGDQKRNEVKASDIIAVHYDYLVFC